MPCCCTLTTFIEGFSYDCFMNICFIHLIYYSLSKFLISSASEHRSTADTVLRAVDERLVAAAIRMSSVVTFVWIRLQNYKIESILTRIQTIRRMISVKLFTLLNLSPCFLKHRAHWAHRVSFHIEGGFLCMIKKTPCPLWWKRIGELEELEYIIYFLSNIISY